jgi:hypothetical protein
VVYIQFRHGKDLLARVLDLVHIDGKPIAVLTWIVKGGKREMGEHTELDPILLRPTPDGAFWYDGIIEPNYRQAKGRA